MTSGTWRVAVNCKVLHIGDGGIYFGNITMLVFYFLNKYIELLKVLVLIVEGSSQDNRLGKHCAHLLPGSHQNYN